MFRLGRSACAAALMIAAGPLLVAMSRPQSNTNLQKRAVILSVWKPSREATQALKEAMLHRNGTKQTLLKIMKEDHASAESLSFAGSFSTEAAYLSAIEDPVAIPADGFAVGEITYPFRQKAIRTYVILNGRPKVVDVTDLKFLKHIDITSSKDFKALWGSSRKAQCAWSDPQGYNIQPGAHDRTEIEVAYPIADVGNGKVIGFAYVVFSFSFPDRTFLGTELEMVTDTAHKYFGGTAERRDGSREFRP